MQPPRVLVPYVDARGRSDVADALRALDPQISGRVFAKLGVLASASWTDLFKLQHVKELKGTDGIYELRPAGIRLTFFVTNCRGQNETVVTDVEKRADLAGVLWQSFIRRAEQRRDDWKRRNCGG